MPIKILMPALSPTMTHGNLSKWLKKEGDVVKAGQILAEIETDKAAMEVEAVDEGILAKILIKEGAENVSVNSPIAVILEEGEDEKVLEDFLKQLESADKVDQSAKSDEKSGQSHPEPGLLHTPSGAGSKQPQKEILRQAQDDNGNNTQARDDLATQGHIFVSPLARRIAKEKGIDLSQINGSGPHGRIIKADVEGARISNVPSRKNDSIYRNPQEYSSVQNSAVRKIIAKRLLEAKQTIPHFYLSIECNIDKLLELRSDINSALEGKEKKVSVNDFVILASAKALSEVKEVNASFEQDAIRYYNNIDVSVAVATKDGLITPIIKNADQKCIKTISSEMKELAHKAKDNKLMLDEFQGGGFTISNLGMFDINNFSAIINPPQSCILAVGAGKKMPIVIEDQIKIANIMNVTLSCDHRVVDGVVGAKFLSVFKRYIEKPALMLM